jgi:PBS lyase HEAT-like repeat-containing protein
MRKANLHKHIWILFLVTLGICCFPEISKGATKQNKDPIEMVQTTINNIIDEDIPIDILSLIKSLKQIPDDIAPEKRRILMQQLGRMLLHEKKIKFSQIPKTGRDPNIILKSTIIDAFARIGEKEDVIYLQRFYEQHGGTSYQDLPSAIEKLGGKLPLKNNTGSKINERKKSSISADERAWQRKEVKALITQIQLEKATKKTIYQSINRIGEIGESQDANPIIQKIDADDIDWIIKQSGIECLGELGGNDAKKYLIKQLQEPIPLNADLDDFGDNRAVLRAQAALALGKCGDQSVIEILAQIAKDDKQFKRVKQACNKAMSKINARSNKQN